MTTAELIPLESALADLARRKVLPTNMDSADMRALGNDFHRQNFTSAKTLLADLLDGYKQKVEAIINPTNSTRPDGSPVTAGLDVPTARLQIKELQKSLGMDVTDGGGKITDLRSDARINLVLQTNRDISQGAGWFIQGQQEEVLAAFPAQELVRIESRRLVRDWKTRFRIAAQVAGDVDAARVLEFTGRMMALKSSGIWQALGDGAGGYTDALGNPFAPFAFNSGMDLRDVAYSQAVELGLLQRGDTVSPQPIDFSNLLSKAA
jgi:hypothetical protein